MDINFFHISLAFIEGFVLIISPCILPILPILLAGGISSGKLRPIGIILGFVLMFSLFTFFVRFIVQYTQVNLDYVRFVAYFLLISFGFIMMSDYLFRQFSRITKSFMSVGFLAKGDGFWSGFLLGTLLSIVWTPCAGPILAAAIVQITIQKSLAESFLVLFFFALGSVIPMILIVIAGRNIITYFNWLRTRADLLRKILGLVIIMSVIVMFFTNDINFAALPSHELLLEKKPATELINGLSQSYPAPLLQDLSGWINSTPLNLAALKGKVVLIDFWTYSCINCIRSLPYLIAWYQKYNKDGFVIIGVHTPEFEFEKNYSNVKAAVKKYGIKYPVALDNNFRTWLNFRNQNWPTHYLIDKNGQVVYQHIGEGEYDTTENNIRYLLGMHTPVQLTYRYPISSFQTPEIYLGYARINNFSGTEIISENKIQDYRYPNKIGPNKWALQGKWLIQQEKIVSAEKNAAIKINFSARNVYAVMGSIINKPILVKILLNDQPTKNFGADVQNNSLQILQHKLYELLKFEKMTSATMELIATEPGVEIYTFTFGS